MKAASQLVCRVLQREVRLLAKQIEMLANLAENAPVARQKLESADEKAIEVEISLLPKEELEQLLEKMKEELSQIRIGIEELAEPGSHSWANWEIVGDDQNLE